MSRPHRPGAPLLAWSLWWLWLALSVLATWQVWQGPATSDTGFGIATVGFATAGALVAWRQPGNAVGWLLIALALTSTVQTLGATYVLTRSPGYLAVAWVTGWVWYGWLLLIGVFVPLVFPDGRLVSRRWRPVLWLGVAALTACIVGTAFTPGALDLSTTVQNPLGVEGTGGKVFSSVQTVGAALLLLAVVLTVASLLVRFRRSRGVERQQLKWFAFAGVVALTGLTLAASAELLPGTWGDPVGAVGWGMFAFAAVLGIPVATGIAIFRYRLYDIDRVVNRTLVYAALTATLLTTYAASVLVLGRLLTPFTGDSDLAVAGSTLAVAALFRPARKRIQDTVDRRFYRHRYDAARTLDDFTTRLRHELDLDAVGTDLRAVTQDVLQPTHVSLWMRP